MPKITPRKVEDKMNQVLNAWEQIAPGKSFGGMTLPQFQAAVAPSKSARDLLEDLEVQTTEAINKRQTADEITLGKIQVVVAGVVADPTEGPDGSLYEAMGYTRRSERKSGLTRKTKNSKGSKDGNNNK